MKRIAAIVALIGLVVGSLIVFPEHLHWMIVGWAVLALVALQRSKRMWPWLLGCVLIVAVKQPGYTLAFWIFAAVFVAAALVDWRKQRLGSQKIGSTQIAIWAVALLSVAAVYGAVRWFAANTSQHPVLDSRPIACLGDSLTDYGYPQDLQELISVPVEDFGVNGIKTAEGIAMIPDILSKNPQLVVIELGGHDHNADNSPRAATKKNLEFLIESFLDQQIAVILVEIPRGFISDPYHGLERELAAKYDLQLIDDSLIRSFVFNSKFLPPGIWLDPSWRYSDDGLHPNDLGNKLFANTVRQALVRVYGDSILKAGSRR